MNQEVLRAVAGLHSCQLDQILDFQAVASRWAATQLVQDLLQGLADAIAGNAVQPLDVLAVSLRQTGLVAADEQIIVTTLT